MIPLGFLHIWPYKMIKNIWLTGDKLPKRGRLLHLIDPNGFKNDNEVIISKYTIAGKEKQFRLRVQDLRLASPKQQRNTWVYGSGKLREGFFLPNTFIYQDPIIKSLHQKIQMNTEGAITSAKI